MMSLATYKNVTRQPTNNNTTDLFGSTIFHIIILYFRSAKQLTISSRFTKDNAMKIEEKTLIRKRFDRRGMVFSTVIVLGWFASNALVGVVNKSLFQLEKTRFPILLTSLHMLSSFVLCHVYLQPVNRGRSLIVLPRGLWMKVLALSVVFSSSIALGNVALQYLDLPLIHMVSSLTPVATFFVELLFLTADQFNSKYTKQSWYSMCFLVGGAVLSTIGDAEFQLFGFVCAMLSTFLRAIKSLLQEYLLKGECVETTIYLLYLMSFPSFIFLLVFGTLFEYDVLFGLWQLQVLQLKVVSLVILSSLAAFSYNIFGFLVSMKASAVAIHILGNIKVVLCIAASLLVFGNNVSVVSWIGVVLTLFGGAVFWYGKQQNSSA